MWKSTEFVRVAVATTVRYHSNPSGELTILGEIFCAIGSGTKLISLSGSSHTLVDCHKEYLGSGCTKTLVDYHTFDVRLLKWCLWKIASVVFRTPVPFSITEFTVTRLKGAEHRDWMQSRQSLRMDLKTCDLSFPGLLDVVSNIIEMWPFNVSYLKQAGQKDSVDSLVVGLLFLFSSSHNCQNILVSFLFGKKKLMDTSTLSKWAGWGFTCSI